MTRHQQIISEFLDQPPGTTVAWLGLRAIGPPRDADEMTKFRPTLRNIQGSRDCVPPFHWCFTLDFSDGSKIEFATSDCVVAMKVLHETLLHSKAAVCQALLPLFAESAEPTPA